MRSEQWRGKGSDAVPQWRLEARKAANIARNKSYSSGGLPRVKRSSPSAPSMPKLRCLEPTTR